MKGIYKFVSKLLLLSIFINLIIMQGGTLKAAEKSLPSGLNYDEISEAIENYFNEHEKTNCGMNVIVYDRDEVLYQNAFGYMDKEQKIKSQMDTVYDWGSISKLLIWVSVMQLYEDGLIDLNADIKNYLPDNFLKNLSFDKPITMIDLMNHKAGFQDTYFIQTTKSSEIGTLEEALSIRQPKQIYEPGEHTAYSNWSAALAAYIVERASGLDYVDYVHKAIFDPLNMEHTSISPTYDDRPWMLDERLKLKCYDAAGEAIIGPSICYIHLYPAGSACGTIADLKTFARALTPDEAHPSPLFKKQSTLDEMYTATSFYGSTNIPKNYHGFFSSQYALETIGHGGNTFGCSSMLQFDPISGIGMLVMTNQAHESTYNYDMYELVYGKFTDSKLAQTKRTVPKGLILNTRGIIEGPLSFLGALGVSSYSEEDLETWWYEEDGVVETQFSDFVVSTPKAICNVLCMLFFIIAGVYGLLKIFIGGVIIDPIKKRKGKIMVEPLRKYSYLTSSMMALALINLLVEFIRLSKGYRTGDIGSAASYKVQSIIFLVLIILLAATVFFGYKNNYEDALKDEKRKFTMSSLLAITQVLVMVSFDMYKFWML